MTTRTQGARKSAREPAPRSQGHEVAFPGLEKIVLVTRKTRLEALIARFNTRDQAKFYIEHAGVDFSEYEEEHATYRRALDAIRSELDGLAKLHEIERSFVPNYLF